LLNELVVADAIYEADIHITFIPPGSAEQVSRRRDVFDEGDFEPLPFDTRTLTFRNDNEYDDCAGEMQLTAVTTDANGETTAYTEINSLTIDIPDSYPFSVRLTHDQDEAYFTTFDFSNVTYQWVKGSSPQSTFNITRNMSISGSSPSFTSWNYRGQRKP